MQDVSGVSSEQVKIGNGVSELVKETKLTRTFLMKTAGGPDREANRP